MEALEVDVDAAKDVGMNTIEGVGADPDKNVTADGQIGEPTEDSQEKIESIENDENIGNIENIENIENGENIDDVEDAENIEDIEDIEKIENIENAENNIENIENIENNEISETLEDDLPELISAVPHLWQLGSIKEIGDYPRYAELRALGLSVGEAYYAVNGAKEAERAAKNSENAQLDAGLSHLTAVAAAGNPPVRVMSELERKAIRAALGEDIGERELERLWRRVNS